MSARLSFFHFKQFSIEQTHFAMKVGTDAVLFGAWVDLKDVQSVLDMGTGTGILALMLAQRLAKLGRHFHITAVEKDERAVRQARQNFAQSPWAGNLQLHQGDIGKCLPKIEAFFDHIVANPPYFDEALPCRDKARHLARYKASSHLQWLHWAMAHLTPTGRISFVLPFEAGIALKQTCSLACIRQCDVITKAGKSPRRMLLTFSKKPAPLQTETLTIYNENNTYTDEFTRLTCEFYLKMSCFT